MDEARIREIVREELARARSQGTDGSVPMREALEAFQGEEITTFHLATLGCPVGAKVGRREQSLAGWVLRLAGWVPQRRGSGSRERVYVKAVKRAA